MTDYITRMADLGDEDSSGFGHILALRDMVCAIDKMGERIDALERCRTLALEALHAAAPHCPHVPKVKTAIVRLRGE